MQVICVEMTVDTMGVRMETSEADCVETRSEPGRTLTVSERSSKKS